jgi:hypothetical protein
MPNMYESAFEIAKRIGKVFYPSEKLKLLTEAYQHAQISQGLCNLDEDNVEDIKLEPLAEEI